MPFPLPDGVTVHQVWLLTAVQEQFAVSEKLVEPAGVSGTFWFDGVTASVQGAAAWVTVTTTGVSPATVTVIFEVRGSVLEFIL